MFESPPVDLDVLRRLDSTTVDHTNQGDSFLRVRSDVNAIANAAADEIERLRHSLAGVLDWADRHRISYPEHDHDCFEEWCAERDYARTLLPETPSKADDIRPHTPTDSGRDGAR